VTEDRRVENLTGKMYLVSALKGRHADRVPVTVLPGPYCAGFAGISVREFLTNAASSAKAQVAFYERFQPDSAIVVNDVYLESEALGCELDFPEDDISHIKAPLLTDKGGLGRLKAADPQRDGRLPYYLEVCERMAAALPQAAIGGSQAGPWNIAMNLRGHEALLDDTFDDPGFVHELMRLTTDTVKAFCDASLSVRVGPAIHEASASCSLISPKIYREFIQPYHKELREYFRAKRVHVSLHICGFIDPMLEDVIDVGLSPLSIDNPTSLEKAMGLAKERRVTVMGNVQTTLFHSGTREAMEEDIRRCIDTAAPHSHFILASGCEIPRNSTVDRIDHYFQYARTYGREFIEKLL
jgi:uroporphyrinogen decarboxylase